ncbi:hypothetical protein BYT27DRAFT_7186816 [Phlegmacium glaucopus]|nr:hypothetical protein BYT27DRAFT_7186816 [Phlegmacium glaucopus]
MSAEVITQVRTADSNSRGRGRKGNSNRNTRGGSNNTDTTTPPNRRSNNRNTRGSKEKNTIKVGVDTPSNVEQASTTIVAAAAPQSETSDSDNVCWICAEPVKYYSVSECSHRTCHVCAIRLRALYKKTDCTFCKLPQTIVIFTASPDAPFSSYNPETMQFKDTKLSVYFETQEMMEDTLILLRFNCPDSECAYIGNGWGDLRLHVRATHAKLLCDLCIRHKKVFSHEHTLYLPALLHIHLPSSNARPGKAPLKEPIDGGIHPRCGFCRECFFGDDELYSHMRDRHEECFLCKRNGVRDQYFENYESLERHFNSAHHPCLQADCQVRKFVVFNTALDLKAHTVEEHGGDMNARDKKDARRVHADFLFGEVGGRHGQGRRDRDRDRERERDHEPPPPQALPPPLRQQQVQTSSSSATTVPPPGSGARRREAFGGGLTQGGDAENNNRGISRPSTPQAEVDQAVMERHAGFLARLQSLSANPTTAVPAVKAATRGYRHAETSARDLILTIWNVVDQKLDHTASIVNAFVDLVDEEDKKQDILTAWKSFEIEQRRQFPELVPSSFGSEYAGITSGRVLNAKHSSATRSSSQQVWNRVALAAGSSSAPPSTQAPRPFLHAADRFPTLSGGGNGANSSSSSSSLPGSGFRQGPRTTPWSGSSIPSSSLGSSRPAPTSVNVLPPSKNTTKAPKLSSTLFPELPSLNASRAKPQVSGNVSLKKILGSTTGPAVSAWQPSNSTTGDNSSITTLVEDQGFGEAVGEGNVVSDGGDAPATTTVVTPTKGKKGKAKQKQTLFTLGSR